MATAPRIWTGEISTKYIGTRAVFNLINNSISIIHIQGIHFEFTSFATSAKKIGFKLDLRIGASAGLVFSSQNMFPQNVK